MEYNLDRNIIRWFIKENFKTQKEFANQCNISENYLSLMLSGKRKVDKTVIKILIRKNIMQFLQNNEVLFLNDEKFENTKKFILDYCRLYNLKTVYETKSEQIKSKIAICSFCNIELTLENKFGRYLCCLNCKSNIHKIVYNKTNTRAYRIWDSAKRRAKSKNIPFDIEVMDIELKLEKGICEVSGIPFEIKNSGESFNILPFAPSLDRIDNSKGYIKDNIQLVCFIYNVGKNRFRSEDFSKLAFSFVDYQNKIEGLKND